MTSPGLISRSEMATGERDGCNRPAAFGILPCMAEAATPQRSILLVRPPGLDGVGVFRITIGPRSWFYTIREIRCEIGGRGFAVHRLGLGTLYHVRVGPPEECSCECLGYLRYGRCRHVMGLLALIKRGML
jgi:SWIM zinc finger